ncbi:MAG: DUF2284 domain-containing protein [Chloroflexi bacterium]|nr:DUF2284 domain-containing protein [Chloroflexota bacterium]
MVREKSLEDYCQRLVAGGATHAVVTDPKLIVTSPWVRWKCQFGCADYGKHYGCPPYSPAPEDTRRNLDSYHRAILAHLQWTKGLQRGREIRNFIDNVLALERELFLDGYYRAFGFSVGPCSICEECAVLHNRPCSFRDKVRPSMESCGIDVFQTARHHGLPIDTLRTQEQTRNYYLLVLVD